MLHQWKTRPLWAVGNREGRARTRFQRSLCLAAFALTMACLATNAHAQTVLVNLDYNSNFSGTTQSGAAVVGSAGDFWNASPTFFDFLGTETEAFPGDPNAGNTGGGAQGAFELLNTAGVASGISYQMSFVNDGFGFNGAFENLGAVAATSAANLLGDYVFVGEADAGEALNFELTGLATNTSYSLYLYGNGDALGQGATWNLNGSSQTSAFDGTATFDDGGEYVLFNFDTGASTTQSFTATELTTGIAVNGFQLVVNSSSTVLGDFDLDGDVDLVDLDQYNGNIGAAATGALEALDLDGDGTVGANDFQQHYTDLVETSNGQTGTFAGDVNLDGTVNVLGDAFALIGNLNNAATSWSQGDLNADGTVNVLGDAFALVGNLGNSNNPSE